MDDKSKDIIDDKPPFLGSWNKIYLFVFGELVILILLFYLFTKAFG
jgi:hypothetical protein